MDFNLPDIGTAIINDEELSLTCDFKISYSEFSEKIGGKLKEFLQTAIDPKNLEELLQIAIDSKNPIKLPEMDKMHISSFFMKLTMDLRKMNVDDEMKKIKEMRICGAAHFIPPHLKKEDDD
jgi:hypothetical protein